MTPHLVRCSECGVLYPDTYVRCIYCPEPKREKRKSMSLRDIIIYVAGPYRADNEWQVEENIREAEKYALMLWEAGFTAICPHKNTAHFGGAHGLPDDVWLDGDLTIIARCNGLLLLPRWLDSEGTKQEKAHAEAHGIPVFHATPDFIPTIKQFFADDGKIALKEAEYVEAP